MSRYVCGLSLTQIGLSPCDPSGNTDCITDERILSVLGALVRVRVE